MTTPSTRFVCLSNIHLINQVFSHSLGLNADSPNFQMVIESLLDPSGYVLTRAMDGDEALGLMKSRDYLPDLILLDVEMFGKTGYDVRTVASH
jgi:CheY-like chemotaxis protein